MAAALTTPAAVVNAAIQLVGGFNNNNPVTGTPPEFDGSTYGLAAGAIYNEVVYAVGRSFGYDFSRNVAALSASGNAPPFPWSKEYLYPTSGIQVLQLMPPSLSDPNNPLPVNWSVGNTLVGSNVTKVIWTNLASATALISNTPPEGAWDALFQETVIRELAAKLSMANVGKPDLMNVLNEQGERVQSLSTQRDS